MAFVPPSAFTTRPTLQGTFGMSASTHWSATGTAQSVLERGGNAFDAAVAAGFVLHVVEPHLNGPGGDLVGIFATASDPTPRVLAGQGPAPDGASIAHLRGEGLDLVPGAGALAAAVPGAVDAWLLMLLEHGTWELADVLAYTITMARDGHPVLPRVAATVATVARLFQDHWTTSADLWMPHGRPPHPGEIIRNHAYADTLGRLVSAGRGARTREARIQAARAEWKHGHVARQLEAAARRPHRHSSGTVHAGVLTAADVASFAATVEPAVTLDFRGSTIAKAGPWTQGPALLQALAILEGLPDEALDPSTELGAHTVLEVQKLALADREAYYGHDVAPDLLAVLLSPDHAARRRALLGDEVSHRIRPSDVPGHEPFAPPLVEEGPHGVVEGAGEPTVARDGETRGDTCHVDVVDRWGNMVAVTPSGGWLQSSPTVPGLGFCLGTRLQMTWLTEGAPSSLRPGRRPRTTLTPTLVLRDGLPVSALGSPGGDQQDQWQLLYLLRTIVGGYSPQQAIDAPALHTTSVPSSFWPRTWTPGGAVVEDRLGSDVVDGLRRRGHHVTLAGEWSLGRLSSVSRDPRTGRLSAAANPRGAQGYAAGR
ncbi:gamma-glutamyltransferase family protein [Sanguibacter suaedae]|uniref:Gamma-glutamyltransferase n=1 Tax=Sanguibacter suaedae TaxID=2795737 RepID=A0A934IB35_9MICO|nr:gamma-glutamyltransferase [Sanguibacter suaedae]MBI9115445.1 gamma-glutamyltransferase [Sanguibacter suaedae]